MIAKPPHDRKFAIIAIDLVKIRLPKSDMKALGQVRDELEAVLIGTDFFRSTPFLWITLSIRLGLKDDETPCIGRVSKKYGDLPLTIEIDAHELLNPTFEQMCNVFRRASLRSLIHVGKKFSCPTENLEEMTAEPPAKCDYIKRQPLVGTLGEK